MLISEIRGSNGAEQLLKAASGHNGVITTIHASDQILELLKEKAPDSSVKASTTGMRTIDRLLDSGPLEGRALCIEDAREIGGIHVINHEGAQSYIVEGSPSTGMCTSARLNIVDPERDYQEPVLFNEETREVEEIQVIDHPWDAGSRCQCGHRAMFDVYIYGQRTIVCPECLANLGKSVINALT